MSVKEFGAVDIAAADTAEDLFQMPVGGGSFTIRAVNRNATVVKVRIGFSATTAAFEDERYVEYDAEITPGIPLEGAGFVAEEDTFIVIQSDTTDVNFIAYGGEG